VWNPSAAEIFHMICYLVVQAMLHFNPKTKPLRGPSYKLRFPRISAKLKFSDGPNMAKVVTWRFVIIQFISNYSVSSGNGLLTMVNTMATELISW
jgi:hypothetical protein